MAVIAVDCGGTNLAVARYASGRLTASGATATPGDAADLPEAILAAVLPRLGDSVAVGIGVAGLVDTRTGTLVWMPHTRGDRVAIAAPVGEHLGLPVTVDNDANLAGLAEARAGAGRGHRMVLTLTLGTGIGGGLTIGGEIERGRGFLGEVGHLVLEPGGAPCPCGGAGCWETLVSGRVLDARARSLAAADPRGAVAAAAGPGPASGAHLVAAAPTDPDAAAEIEAVGRELGRGLALLVAALDPDAVVVTGGAAAAGEMLLAPARAALGATVQGGTHRKETPVLPGDFGAESGLIGAALAAEAVS
jgi:glucokinase